MPAPIAPWMSASDALTIWMSSTAMKAPSVEPMTAIQVLSEAVGALGTEAGEVRGDVAADGIEEALEASAVMTAFRYARRREVHGWRPFAHVRPKPSPWC